jgi:hypothetical protein
MKWVIGLIVLLAPPVFAEGGQKQCEKDCREFVTICQKSCEQNVDRKNRKVLEGCKKNCQDFEKMCVKECAKDEKH